MQTKEILKKLRKEKDYSAQQVADGCSMSLGVYKKYESGERGVGTPALCKLADFYGVTTDYLLGRGKAKSDVIAQLCNEYNLNMLERVIVTAYVSMDKNQRVELIRLMQQLVDNAEQQKMKDAINENSNQEEQQAIKPAITKIETQQMAVARTSDPEKLYRPAPTEEQMKSFIPGTPDMLGE